MVVTLSIPPRQHQHVGCAVDPDRTAGGRVVGKIWRSNAPRSEAYYFYESDSACIK